MSNPLNKTHSKASIAEEKAKQHLISVGLYGRSVSIISNSFRLTSIIKSYAENHVLKQFNLSFWFYSYVGYVGLGRFGDCETS